MHNKIINLASLKKIKNFGLEKEIFASYSLYLHNKNILLLFGLVFYVLNVRAFLLLYY